MIQLLIQHFASTSSDSVLKTNASKATTYKKESGDVDGPFDIVVSVENCNNN